MDIFINLVEKSRLKSQDLTCKYWKIPFLVTGEFSMLNPYKGSYLYLAWHLTVWYCDMLTLPAVSHII